MELFDTVLKVAAALEPLQTPLVAAIAIGIFRLERRVFRLELKIGARKPPSSPPPPSGDCMSSEAL